MRRPYSRSRGRIFLLLLVIAGLLVTGRQPSAWAQQSAAPAAKAATPLAPADAERTFTDLLRRYFEAYARKDLQGMTSLWHPGGPARNQRNVVLVEFDLRQVALVGLTTRGAAADAGGGRARAILDLDVTNEKTGRTRRERRIRDFTFMQDEAGAWQIWNEVSPAEELARKLLAAPAPERDALIATTPELASDDTLAGLSREAGRLQAAQRYADVFDALTTQARLARALGDQATVGRSQIQIGSVSMLTGKYPEAADAFSAARDAYLAVGDLAETASCDANLANLAYMQGRFAEAAGRYQQAYDVLERLNDDARMASVLHGLGNSLYMQTEFSRALEQYARALTVLRRTKDRYGESNVLQAMAMVHKELGDYPAAIEAWRNSLVITEAGGDVAGTAKAWGGMGEVFRLQGDLPRAIQHHLASLRLWEQLKNVGNCATANYSVGQLYALQRNFPRALESYQKALDLDRSLADDAATSESGQARDLGGMAGAHFAQGQPDLALPEYERSLVLREKRRDDVGVMWTLVHLGVLHASQHRPEEAGRAYQRALALAESKQDAVALSTVLALRARLELDQADPGAALASAVRAVDLATEVEHFDTVAYARVVMGTMHQKADRPAEARAAYEEAVAALAKVPLGPAADTFFDNRRAPYLALVDLLASQGTLAEAFRWSERGRQQALADILGGDGAAVVKGLTVEERDLERAIARDLRTLSVKIRRERGRAKPDAARLAALRAEQEARRSDGDAFRRRIYDAHPALREMRAQGEACGPESAAVLGAPASALLSFVVGEGRTWAFAIARNAATAQWTVQKAVAIDVKAADLGQQVRRFREAIARKDQSADELGRELHALLIDPFQSVLARKTRLVIVPDAVLWSLPFEALPNAAGRYMVEDAAIAYAPSLTALAAVNATRVAVPARRSLVALGKPELAKSAEDRLALARSAPPAVGQPAVERELQGIAALFGAARSKVYLGAQARAERLAQAVAPGTTIHLAVPLVLVEATPLYSLLALAPADGADPAAGVIEIGALMAWTLPADAVVATRVEYGPGAGEGEALMALAWSFYVGGAPTLVLNRWLGGPQDPNVGARFYRGRVGGAASTAQPPSAAESLQKAMKGLLAQAGTRHPFYWAGYMTIGR